MIMCNGAINDAQINYLQDFKLSAAGTDYQRADLAALIAVDWEELRYQPADGGELAEGEGSGPVDMTQEEIMMSNEVEEYSDELKREADADLRGSLGKTTIAFVDIENMGFASKLLLFCLIMAAFGGVLYYFYQELYVYEPDANEIRKEMLRMRKEKKKTN